MMADLQVFVSIHDTLLKTSFCRLLKDNIFIVVVVHREIFYDGKQNQGNLCYVIDHASVDGNSSRLAVTASCEAVIITLSPCASVTGDQLTAMSNALYVQYIEYIYDVITLIGRGIVTHERRCSRPVLQMLLITDTSVIYHWRRLTYNNGIQ